MSTASSIRGRLYPVVLVLAIATAATGGCKKKNPLEDPNEQGKLARIAQRLDEAYATKPLPRVTEPPSLSERLAKWDDFRACTVRTYVARKRRADALAREGVKVTTRYASIGEEAVEECAVESAVVNKDPALCERLAGDFSTPTGSMPLSAVRCWDTRARVLGLPDECPVIWLGDDVPGRNPECLAMAHRDPSFCPFADNAARCRALVANDPAGCAGAAPDCAAAVAYWGGGLIPAPLGPPKIDVKPRPGEPPLGAAVDVRWRNRDKPTIRVQGPQSAGGISWPAKGRAPWVESTTRFWGATIPPEHAQVTWREGQLAVKIAFAPAGTTAGVRPVAPPGPTAGATVVLVWPDPRDFRQCAPGAETTGQLQFDAGAAAPGAFMKGSIEAKNVPCSDGAAIDVSATFRAVVLDVR